LGKNWLINKTGLDYKIARSEQTVFIWNQEKEIKPYNLFEYEWQQKRKSKSARIFISNSGFYSLIVNGKTVYNGPNFGSGKTIYYDSVEIDKYVKTGKNKINIVANYQKEKMHGYQNYPQPFLLVGGWIKDSWRYYNLTVADNWKGGGLKNLKNGQRISADASFQMVANFEKGKWLTELKKVKRLKNIEYRKKKSQLKNLIYEEVDMGEGGGWYDLRKFSGGYVKIDKNGGPACQLKLGWRSKDRDKKYFNQEDEYKLPTGNFSWISLERRGGRYIKMYGDCGDEVKISFRRVKMDWSEPKIIESLTSKDKQIYEMCLQTMRNNVQNQIEDCVERERAMYVGDAREVSRCLMADNKNQNYVKEMIRKVAKSQRKNGAMPAMAPSGDDMLIPGYSLQWLVWLDDYVQKSGDKKLVKEMEDRIREVLKWMRKNEDGLGFMYKQESDNWWNWTDWTVLDERYKYSTGLEIWHYRALRSAQNLFEMTDKKESVVYKDKAEKLREKIREMAFDRSAGMVVDSFEEGKKSTGSVVINGLAGVSGIFDSDTEEQKVIDYFEKTGYFSDSPYSESWIVEWLIKSGRKSLARQIIRQYWGGMIDKGATSVWEIFRPGKEMKQEWSRSHAWGCGPIYLYRMTENRDYDN
ncbi:hypothetical protein DRH14_01675, partial [Candidatus Shapirobacteria bacterium]